MWGKLGGCGKMQRGENTATLGASLNASVPWPTFSQHQSPNTGKPGLHDLYEGLLGDRDRHLALFPARGKDFDREHNSPIHPEGPLYPVRTVPGAGLTLASPCDQ